MDSAKNLMKNDKLCLYCDKTFSNRIEQEKHVDREHVHAKSSKSKGSRRKSERIIIKNSDVEPFQGCFYCSDRKLTSPCDDLEALFQHLLLAHKDVCFVCKCRVRLQSKSALMNHMKRCKIIDKRVEELEEVKVVPATKKKGNAKKMQVDKFDNVVVQCESVSLSESGGTANHQKTRTNAMNKKSENLHNSHNILNKRNSLTKTKTRKLHSSSSSSTISSCSSSKASEEYTIPITRQKNKDPIVNVTLNKKRNTSNKKMLKTSSKLSSNILQPSQPSIFQTSISTPSASKVVRVKPNKSVNTVVNNFSGNSEATESVASTSIVTFSKPEAQNSDFDEDFYKKITCNIKMNLNCFIDGKADRLWNNKFKIENVTSINKQNEQCQNHEKEIHEATNFEVSMPPFPALLTAEQYGFGDSNPQKNKRKFTKNSWKWRWDLIKKYKYVNEGGKIVKKVKQVTTGLKDLSQLDMWTQLSMRSRYENLNIENECDYNLSGKISRRLIKSQNIKQLNTILDNRLTPEIHIEQMQQTLVKEELVEYEGELSELNGADENPFQFLQLTKANTNFQSHSVSLSGEWARPRCFICIDCGQEFDLMKSLNDHKNSEHPYVVSAHYEVVGRENLQHELYKNLFLPKKALNAIVDSKNLSICSESKSNEGSNTSQDTSINTDQKEKECTKCQKVIKYTSDIDIYRHILDCIEDKVWMQAKRRNKYRRSRRKVKKNNKKMQNKIGDQKRNELTSATSNITGDESMLCSLDKATENSEILTKSMTDNHTAPRPLKNSQLIGDNFIVHNEERINIKSFFRVSKTTPPNLPQKMVVHMLQMPNNHIDSNHKNNSLKQSLRSSTKKHSENLHEDGIFSEAKCITTPEDVASEKNDEKLNKILTNTTFEINESNTSPLHINMPEKIKPTLNSPTNSTNSSLISPTSCSSVPKKKKKLNDCIAMLTCKIQEKLGVNFFENTTSEIFPTENTSSHAIQENLNVDREPCPSPKKLSLLNEQSTFKIDEINPKKQDQVIDLSLKRAPELDHQLNEEILVEDVESTQKEQKISVLSEEINEQYVPDQRENYNQELNLESFKISIARDKIPNLDEILEKQNKNSVSNLNISESERKAFEEQKNRIMKILGKKPTPHPSDTSTTLILKNKVKRTQTRNTKVKAKKDTPMVNPLFEKNNISTKQDGQKNILNAEFKDNLNNNNTVELLTPETESENVKKSNEIQNEANIKGNIEQVIKSTNRIRCRRLSVVVDPIIHLPGFQKNRKIRLTNNSQQNGFYDLLTNDQIFNALRNTTQIQNEIQKLGVRKPVVNESLKEGNSLIKESKARTKKSKKKCSKYANGKVMKVTRKKKTTLAKKDVVKSSTNNIGDNDNTSVETAKIVHSKKTMKSKVASNTQKVSKTCPAITKTSQTELIPTKIPLQKTEENFENSQKRFGKKLPRHKSNEPLHAQSTSKKSAKKFKNKLNCSLPKIKEKTIDEKFDASSDTSLDNDIPLAKLLTPSLDKDINQLKLRMIENLKSKETISFVKEEDHNIHKVLPKLESTNECINNVNGAKEFSSENNSEVKNNEVLSINEDSFFNDDNEIDQTNDKINALVKNIINSSELIDSENERNDNAKQPKLVDCSICMKTFRNDKVLEKHKKTNTHILKEKRKEKQKLDKIQRLDVKKEETKIFRTKGALKTFENILSDLAHEEESKSLEVDEFKPIVEDSTSFIALKDVENLDDEDEELSTKDRIFDSLFSNIENKLQAAQNQPLPKFDFPTLSHHDSESSTTSWDLKHDAELEWDAGNAGDFEGDNSFKSLSTNLINQENASISKLNQNSKNKLNKNKEKEVAVPTKSLIMGKIFKKHRDNQKTPQADAPNNKPSKNSLDEIFDHLKNSAELDDKALTCPLSNSSCDTFSKKFSNRKHVLESASHSNERNTRIMCENITPKNSKESVIELKKDENLDGIGKRKSRRRCAIKMKTFAETWSSDEYEELHDNDIIRLINEIEKRESCKKGKDVNISELSDKKSVQLNQGEGKIKSLKKVRINDVKKSGHKSDDDTKSKPINSQDQLKKRRMSCFVPSGCKNDEVILCGFENKPRKNLDRVDRKITSSFTKSENTSLNISQSTPSMQRRKNFKHRKKPRNKIKNIAYDSDSDFELNLKRKQKSSVLSDISGSEQEDIKDELNCKNAKHIKTTVNEERHPILNDLNVVVPTTATSPKSPIVINYQKHNLEASTAIPQIIEQERICNRTKRHSSEKLYYWSSSSESSDDIEQGDIPERGGIEDAAMIAQQPEQHGWIVGDSHKKLVTLLAHAKIKNKIN